MGKRSSALIEGYGLARFLALVEAAEGILGEDGRLAGQLKLRRSLAKCSALCAIGWEARRFVAPPGMVRRGPIPAYCDELVASCALRLRLDGCVCVREVVSRH